MSKSAKEIFEELGYIDVIEKSIYCLAYKNDLDMIIVFFHKDKTFKKCFEQKKNQNYEQACSITLKELQAINQQCEELGWLDEK